MGKVAILCICVSLVAMGMALKVELLKDEYGTLGTKFDFYDEEYLNGLSTSIETEGPCKNLPRRWLKRPLSVDTRGTCGKVCTELDCQGECTLVLPNVGEQQLSKVDMAKKIQSVQGCFQDIN